MASTSSPYGAQPISDLTGTPRTLRIPFGIASGLASNIFKFQPVYMAVATGTLTPITATTDKLYGFFAGVEYTPTGGRPAVSPFWASGTTYDTTLDMFAYIWPAWLPGLRIQVQADGAVLQTAMPASFNFSNFSAGSTATGLSACTVSATEVSAASQGQLVLTEFATGVNSAVGDAYTDLICQVTYPQVVFTGATSVG